LKFWENIPFSNVIGEGVRAEALMDIYKMLAELREEHEQVEEAILTLERLARSRGSRRGRPPFWWKEAAAGSESNIGPPQQSNPLYDTEPRRRGRPPGRKKQPKQIIDGERQRIQV
jgi:hypothetical protein